MKIRNYFTLLLVLKLLFCIGFNSHGVVPYVIAFRFDLVAPTRSLAVFFLTSNMLLKGYSDFLALGLLSVGGVMVDMGVLLVNHSGVETIVFSIISLNCCWLSQFSACLYNFLMFWRRLYSKRIMLLNYWSIPIVFVWYLILSDCNIYLNTKHYFQMYQSK